MKCLELLQRLSLKLLLFFVFFFTNSFGATIFVKPEANIESERITLKDVAVIKGTQVEKLVLSDINILPAPSPCKERVLPASLLKEKVLEFLKDNKISLNILVKGSPFVK
ncbi:MAG: hypothetical protein ABGX27_03635, partial [Desulfurobacteriaceae bacterium]